MESGVKIQNPGMSVWIFVVLSRLVHASTPPELARSVQFLNILSLLILAFFSLWILPEPEKLPWYWATALVAVNPIAVLLQRKIWAQSTLPFFCVLLWIAWHYRRRWAGAFAWGLLGLCLGQIHMSGFFLAAGLFLWTAVYDRQARWGAWLLGSLVGVIPLVPWLRYMAARNGTGLNPMDLLNIFKFRYWGYWVSDALGIGLNYSLGPRFMDFMRYPLVGETGTYLVAVAHAVILCAGIAMLVSSVKTRGFSLGPGDSTDTSLAIHSILFGTGILMSLSVPVFRHYLIMSFPLEWVWLSRLGLRDSRWGGRYLMMIWMAQLLISISFLVYLHTNHGAPGGDYGVAYQFQTQAH
jgi:hypothetical protein